MNHHDAIGAHLPGDAPDVQRRQKLLATFLPTFEHGGIDEAAATLTQQLDALETTFAQHMKDLNQLL
ncbi:MAG: hypothetical protein K2R98_34070 [Gemmataceae bacterium]|nr:hypothetical protein [Gemmataceae bacterium]